MCSLSYQAYLISIVFRLRFKAVWGRFNCNQIFVELWRRTWIECLNTFCCVFKIICCYWKSLRCHLLVRIFRVRFIYLRPHYGDFLLLILIRCSYALYFSMQNSIVYRLASVHYFNPLLRKLESTFLSYELCNTGAF